MNDNDTKQPGDVFLLLYDPLPTVLVGWYLLLDNGLPYCRLYPVAIEATGKLRPACSFIAVRPEELDRFDVTRLSIPLMEPFL